MCFAESHPVATACAVEQERQALRASLADVAGRPEDWQPLLELLVVLHRLNPADLRRHLGGHAAAEAEALRASLRRLAAEEEPMASAERRRRVLRVGDELLSALDR